MNSRRCGLASLPRLALPARWPDAWIDERGGTRVNGPILAALQRAAGNDAGAARSTRKKRNRQCLAKEEDRCSADVATCRTQVLVACGSNDQCVADATPCCETCSADGFVSCLLLSGASRNAVVNFG